jgi:hypothetical protein
MIGNIIMDLYEANANIKIYRNERTSTSFFAVFGRSS